MYFVSKYLCIKTEERGNAAFGKNKEKKRHDRSRRGSIASANTISSQLISFFPCYLTPKNPCENASITHLAYDHLTSRTAIIKLEHLTAQDDYGAWCELINNSPRIPGYNFCTCATEEEDADDHNLWGELRLACLSQTNSIKRCFEKVLN